MKRLLAFALVVSPALVASCGSCGSNVSRSSAAVADGRAVVVGTVLDAGTGEPVSGVKVEGPEGRTAKSDARGRFELSGLPVGTSGDVRAETADGRKAHVTLRALGPGRLEVVLQLTAR